MIDNDEPKRLIPKNVPVAPPGWGMVVIQNNTESPNPPPPTYQYFKFPDPTTDGTIPVAHLVDNPTET